MPNGIPRDPKKGSPENPLQQNPSQQNASQPNAPQPGAPGEEATARSAALQAENEALRDRMLRALADAENARRRAERTAQDARRYGIADFARELLPVADNLQRTVTAAELGGAQATGANALLEGVAATRRMLEHALEQFGVRRIEALGEPFNPAHHEAVVEVADGAGPPGTVVSIIEDGFTIHDRLLRPARVAVARRGERAKAQETHGADGSRGEPGARPRDASA
jgi:molecular chaperone GrpE